MVLPCRYLYALKGPPTPQALTAIRTALQALALMLVAYTSSGSIFGQPTQKTDRHKHTVSMHLPCASTRSPLASILARIGAGCCRIWILDRGKH